MVKLGLGPKICYACNLKGVCDFYHSPKNGPDRSMLIEGFDCIQLLNKNLPHGVTFGVTLL